MNSAISTSLADFSVTFTNGDLSRWFEHICVFVLMGMVVIWVFGRMLKIFFDVGDD